MTTAGHRLLRAASDTGLIARPAEDDLVEEARRTRKDPVDVATTRLRIPREAFYRALARARKLAFLEPDRLRPDPALLAKVPARLLTRKDVLPLRVENGAVLVATSDPDDESTLDTLRRLFDKPLVLAVAEPAALQAAVRHLRTPAEAAGPAWDAVAFLDDLLRQAWLRRASDIHMDAQEDGVHLKLRVDGRLQAWGPPLPHDEGTQLLSRVKVLGGLDIAERREPQDGGFSHKVGLGAPSAALGGGRPATAGHEHEGRGFGAPRHTEGAVEDTPLDVRLATIPARWGERATLRLLGVETRDLTIERLGFRDDDMRRLRAVLDEPHGLVLLTGPTGSGKTTTLYAALRAIAKPELACMTVEDPIEFVIPGITQIAVDRAGKVTFARALRALLRHDPDVLMVGEVRDEETADVALKAAMTGHLVLSSLHTNRAASAVARLVDLGAAPYLVADTLRAVVAQRLVRRLCAACKLPGVTTAAELARLVGPDAAAPHEGASVALPGGCPACMGTGYAGRIAIVEALWVDEVLSPAIARGATELELDQLARQRGARSLAEDGLTKVLAGETSLAEALLARV